MKTVAYTAEQIVKILEGVVATEWATGARASQGNKPAPSTEKHSMQYNMQNIFRLRGQCGHFGQFVEEQAVFSKRRDTKGGTAPELDVLLKIEERSSGEVPSAESDMPRL